ncbi:uncharacterized protein ARB_02966 [Trichophyton benhamiae CBS 112371]|uniref:Uncharacterized protein n=1 Tax=Arthroderma benhamiae (strain ATCC MYA-4681 / CBS 112371) TaxID=663331 RepID=D4B3C9_ARTBC|nr:uncharacterized protein ARB_02966 [Trichophyton benhamiae CBS 112371]EFE30175.1 hypothetical protein ARB_02966 [Trichophyton benhamiae CBS 112371]
MVADALAYHPTVAHYSRFIATTVGRDKVLRTLQYFSRFLAWYLLRTNRAQSTINPFEAMKKQFGLTRKLLRVGKNIEHFKAAAIALDSKPGVAGAPGSDPVLKYLAVGRQLGYGVYLSFDMLTYLDAAGIRKFAAVKKLQAHAQKAWLTGLLCSAIAGVYSMWRLSEMEKKINKKDGEGAVEGKKIQSLGYVNLDDGVLGIAGTVSSLIGLNTAWKKTA